MFHKFSPGHGIALEYAGYGAANHAHLRFLDAANAGAQVQSLADHRDALWLHHLRHEIRDPARQPLLYLQASSK
jgi:hypothetical protein